MDIADAIVVFIFQFFLKKRKEKKHVLARKKRSTFQFLFLKDSFVCGFGTGLD